MSSSVQCPNCGSYHTYPDPKQRHMPLFLALALGVISFGALLIITIPWWLIESTVKQNDPGYLYGYYCGNCAYRWINQPTQRS
jgi:hypothetical protein